MLQKLASRSDINSETILGVRCPGKQRVALYEIDDSVYATTDVCTHARCLLSQNGDVFDGQVECACHGSTFDIRTGENVNPPSSAPLKTYPVHIQGDDVFVDIED